MFAGETSTMPMSGRPNLEPDAAIMVGDASDVNNEPLDLDVSFELANLAKGGASQDEDSD